jgi:hypothetical protein
LSTHERRASWRAPFFSAPFHLSPAIVISREQTDALVAGLPRALDAAREDESPAHVTPERGGDNRLE